MYSNQINKQNKSNEINVLGKIVLALGHHYLCIYLIYIY